MRYKESRSRYFELCRKKKIAYYNGNIKRLNGVRNLSEWWRLSNSIKRKAPKIGNNISSINIINQFQEHFYSLLSGSGSDTTISWTIPFKTD